MGDNLYLRKLRLTSEFQEIKFIEKLKQTCYNGVYPFNLFPLKELNEISFEPITIFYGGNGSGKTTLLNIIAEKLQLTRHSPFNSSAFFSKYVSMCEADTKPIPPSSQILTSDDISDYLLHIRSLNNGIDSRREDLFEDYLDRKHKDLRFTSLADYDEWKEGYDAKFHSKSAYVKDRLMPNVNQFSNGETAMKFYVSRIDENALYLIDEPENSLSAKLQLELAEYIQSSARYYHCQFLIATHSPLLLSMEEARIYDLDRTPVTVREWTELENVKIYYDFFKKHQDAFI